MPRTCTLEQPQPRKSVPGNEAESRSTCRLNDIPQDEARQKALELVYIPRGTGRVDHSPRTSVIPTFPADRVRNDVSKTGATSAPHVNKPASDFLAGIESCVCSSPFRSELAQ